MQNPDYPFITPSSTCLTEDLLFFDTFSHSGSEKDNFDLVQFPSPVVIDLIKIVPLGQPIEAKIPGNVRLGATNPSNCELEFFINDLSKQDAHTMMDLGKFYCSEKETDFNPPSQIQTDGLLLRGSYRTLTLAIFGQIATYDEKVEDEQVILSAASPPAQTPASPVASERDMPYLVRSVDQEIIRRARDESQSFDGSTLKSGELLKEDSLIDNIDMIEEPTLDMVAHSGNLIDQEIVSEEMSSNEAGGPFIDMVPHDRKNDTYDYSNNSADVDIYSKQAIAKDGIKEKQSNDQPSINNNNDHVTHEIDQEAKEWSFDASSYNPKPLIYFADPSLTLQERNIFLQSTRPGYSNHSEKEVEKLKEMFEAVNRSNGSKTDDWVTLIEDSTNDIANMSLNHLINNDEMLKFLVTQVCHGLDIELALRQKQTGFKVRHLRAGIKLATILFHCGTQAISALLEASIPQKVLLLYDKDQMSLPLRLLIFKCLNTICDTVEGVEHVISHKYDWTGSSFSLEKAKKLISERDQTKRAEIDQTSTREDVDNQCQADNGEDINFAQLRKQSPEKQALFDEDCETKSLTCYQYMLLILLSQPTTRVTITIGNLIKKIRFYHDLKKLAAASVEEQEESEDSVFASEKPNVEVIIQTMQDVVQLLKSKAANIAQPVRYLPAKVQFQVKPNSSDTYIAIYKWLKHFRTLDYLNTLLSSSLETEQSIKLQNLCLLFVQQILDSPRGTQLFLSHDFCETSGSLLKSLIEKQHVQRTLRISEGIENYLNAPMLRNEASSVARHNDMGLRLAYSFKIFSCIDKLFHFHREVMSKRESSTSDPEKILHQLYIMSEHPYGLSALGNHLSSIGNLDCLLRFLDMPEYSKQLEFVKETSIDYTLELVGTFFRLNNNVLEIADEYLDTLIDLCKTKDKTLSARIKSLLHWLTPFDTEQPMPLINYSEDTFRQLTRVIRKSIPNYSIPFAKGLNFELPPQMITAVRILRQLCIPPQVESFIETNFDIFSLQKLNTDEYKSSSFMAFVDSLPHQQNQNQSWNLNLQLSRHIANENPYEDSISEQLTQISNTFKLFQPYDENICGELKYHYGIMQVFEQEGLKRLLNTLRELTGNYPRPIYQSAALSGFRGRIVISYIHSVIILVHSIVCHLIDARGSEFKDNSVIPAILETYSLLCFVPKPQETNNETNPPASTNHTLTYLQKSSTLRNDNYQLAQQTKKLILSILMSYTQMCLSVSESEEKVISKSMWTKMLREVIEFTLSTPVFFHHGLDVLTKILPSPLPCSSVMDSIDQEQLFKNINHRKLWSAHLHPLHQQIEQMISVLSICYQSNIRTLLCYLCNQLCDLSSNAACMVAKTITDTLISCAARLTLDTNGASPEHALGDDRLNANVLAGTKESAYAVKMILNLLSNLITNQAFETAFTNHLQVIGKKDEKLLTNLQNTLKLHEDYHPGELVEESLNTGSTNNCMTSVVHFIDTIKAMNDSATKDGFPIIEVEPPEELTKINLIDLARKTSDRISLSSSLWTTYRLKVLMDLNSYNHRSSESTKRFEHAPPYNYQEISAPSSHKSYVAPIRGRGRSSVRPDSFRSRPQNTSRPPSIHVDDFNDLYGDNSGRYTGGVAKSSEYRSRRLKTMR